MEPLAMLGIRHRDKLLIQDALLAIAVCAAESSKKAGFDYIPHIVTIALAHPMFSNKIETVTTRINHLVNAIKGGDREKFVDLAVTSLPSELKETAFAWAADMPMGNGIPADKKRQFLKELAAKLSVDSDVAGRITDVSALRNCIYNYLADG